MKKLYKIGLVDKNLRNKSYFIHIGRKMLVETNRAILGKNAENLDFFIY